MVEQGDVFWADFGARIGSAPAGMRPCVIVQSNLLNISGIRTVVVCLLTTTLSRGGLYGNVLLDNGEGGLPQRSVVVVSQLFTLDRSELLEPIGTLSQARTQEIVAGIKLILEPWDVEPA